MKACSQPVFMWDQDERPTATCSPRSGGDSPGQGYEQGCMAYNDDDSREMLRSSTMGDLTPYEGGWAFHSWAELVAGQVNLSEDKLCWL